MGLSTADEYRVSLDDGRVLWYRGRRIPDILAEPDLRVAVDHAALDYEVGHDPAYHDLAVAKDPDTGEDFSAYYRSRARATTCWRGSRLIETVTGARRHDGHADQGDRHRRAVRPAARARGRSTRAGPGVLRALPRRDLAVGGRRRPTSRAIARWRPHAQPDPDHYLHVVDERADGIVVRGAKCHTQHQRQRPRDHRAADAGDGSRRRRLRGVVRRRR